MSWKPIGQYRTAPLPVCPLPPEKLNTPVQKQSTPPTEDAFVRLYASAFGGIRTPSKKAEPLTYPMGRRWAAWTTK